MVSKNFPDKERPQPDDRREEGTTAPGELPAFSKILRKGAVLVIVGLLIALVLQYTPLERLLHDLQEGKSQIADWGWYAPFVFVGLTAFFVMIGIPRLVFCFIGGLGFGFVEGLIWSQVGTILGAYLTYLFARYLARPWVLQRLQRYPKLHKWFGSPSILSVFLVRQIPVGGVLLNLALGVSTVRSVQFLLGSLLGFLPEAVLVTLVGSGLGKDSPEMMLLQIGIFTLCLLTGLWWLWNYQPFRTLIRNKWKIGP